LQLAFFGASTALVTLEDALASLAQVATHARRRCGETVPDLPAEPGQLAGAVSRVVATDDAAARSALAAAIEARRKALLPSELPRSRKPDENRIFVSPDRL